MKMNPKVQFGAVAVILAFSAAILFAQTRWLPGDGWGFPADASTDGFRIDRLIIVTGFFVTLLFIITCIWLVYACVKHGRGHEAEYDHGDSKHAVTAALVLSGLIFFIVDGNLFANSAYDTTTVFWNYDEANEDPSAVRIEVNARQWAWDARYAGADGEFNTADDIVTLNDIRVPTGRPVVIQLAATDVLHGFYVPNLRQKMDAVPGTVNPTWFRAAKTGEYEIACAQHCGMAHYLMKGKLTILEPGDYDAWAAQAAAISARLHDPADEGAQWGWPWQEM